MTFCKKYHGQLIDYQVVENGFTHANLIEYYSLIKNAPKKENCLKKLAELEKKQ